MSSGNETLVQVTTSRLWAIVTLSVVEVDVAPIHTLRDAVPCSRLRSSRRDAGATEFVEAI